MINYIKSKFIKSKTYVGILRFYKDIENDCLKFYLCTPSEIIYLCKFGIPRESGYLFYPIYNIFKDKVVKISSKDIPCMYNMDANNPIEFFEKLFSYFSFSIRKIEELPVNLIDSGEWGKCLYYKYDNSSCKICICYDHYTDIEPDLLEDNFMIIEDYDNKNLISIQETKDTYNNIYFLKFKKGNSEEGRIEFLEQDRELRELFLKILNDIAYVVNDSGITTYLLKYTCVINIRPLIDNICYKLLTGKLTEAKRLMNIYFNK